MLKQELAPRGVGSPVLQGEEEVKARSPYVYWSERRDSNSRPSAPKAAMRPFKINNLGHFCLTALCFLPIVFYSYSQTRLDRF